ncbi:thiol-disulfide oxidoreductase DCC family protein [Rubritalea sp.]|uniref:thiol-disulfide oxidoreductase DCC family protein n=1 Tax=Rubritalea sp. TaxID=2109375 RepID=UPI003EF601B3
MKLNDDVEWVEVYYDGQCGMCCTFHEWVNRQERANDIVFLPYQSEEALNRFPTLNTRDPARQMVVRTSTDEIYQGAEAWVWCLWSCTKYRGLAKKVSKPQLLPQVQKICHLLAANRLTLSKLFFRGKSKEVAARVHHMPEVECDGTCAIKSD